jgi:hypothetical protein
MIYRQGSGEIKRVGGTAPTERVDGTALPPSEISHYARFLTYDGGQSLESAVVLVNGEFDEDIDIDAATPGTYLYWYQTVDTVGNHSVDSAGATLDILAPFALPLPPSGIG